MQLTQPFHLFYSKLDYNLQGEHAVFFFKSLKLLIDTINLQDERMQVQGISTLALLSDLNRLHLLYAVFCQNNHVL